jgi:hemerythrin
MITKDGDPPPILITWSKNYATGIKQIDDQHMELVSLTNELYQACPTNGQEIQSVFKEVMGRMVAYVRYHFTAELEVLERIHFPDYHDHKKQHDQLVVQILEAAKEYNEGRKYAANSLVRKLKDWVFDHIGVYDKIFALYVAEQRKKGLFFGAEFGD